MTWARIDDAILDNPKIAAVGPLGFALHVAAITYCARNLTDGRVPYGHARRLLSTEWTEESREEGRPPLVYDMALTCGISGYDGEEAIEHLIGLLCEVGLWRHVHHGYIVHDYLDYNPSREKVLADRAKKQASGKAGGQASAQARAEATAQAKSKPVPVPVPIGTNSPLPPAPREAAKRSKERELVLAWLKDTGYEPDYANANKLCVSEGWTAAEIIAAGDSVAQYKPKRVLTYIQAAHDGRSSALSRVKVQREEAAHANRKAEYAKARPSPELAAEISGLVRTA